LAKKNKIPLSSPDITDKEKKAVMAVLNTPSLSLGPKLDEFEKKFAKYIGTKFAVAVNSGTSGLHLCVKALNIGEGDEVITTPFSFIASSNCALFERAKPVFADIRPDTLNIDEEKIEAKISKRTKAILPVHVFGYPANMPQILKIAKKHKLAIIEDACEAIGAEINHKKVGSLGDAGVFAFYPNKQMTTGEGGMIVTNNSKIAELAKSMRNQGRSSAKWLSHDTLGYNYRLSEMNCALGIAQLARIKEILKKREKVAKIYQKYLTSIPGVILPQKNSENITRSWFVYVIRLDEKFKVSKRDGLAAYLTQKGIGCGEYFPSIHLEPFYQQMGYRAGQFPLSEEISKRTVALPFFNNLTEQNIKYITDVIKKYLSSL
jgi:perosamine synthetase